MATFLQQQPDEFTPYIPKIDLEVYLAAATQRQQEYDQNLARVQQAFDYSMGMNPTVPSPEEYERKSKNKDKSESDKIRNFESPSGGGLQVMRSVDQERAAQLQKQMQSEISKLGKVDFSSQKIFNRAMGITKTVTDDPQIRNAIVSTANIHAQNAEREKYREKGETSEQNDFLMRYQQQEYLASDDPLASYNNTEYIPHQDWVKEFAEFMKTVEPTATLEQTGIDIEGAEGLMAYALNEHGDKKYLPKERIQSLYRQWLQSNPTMSRQLEIDAFYFAHHTSDEATADILIGRLHTETAMLSQGVERAKTMMSQTTDSTIKEMLQKEIDSYTALLGDTEKRTKEIFELIKTDPLVAKREAYKYNMEQMVMDQHYKSDAFSKVVDNKFRKQVIDEQQWNLGHDLAERKFAETVRMNNYTIEKNERDAQDKINADKSLIIPLGIAQEEAGSSGYFRLVDEVKEGLLALDGELSQTIFNYLSESDTEKRDELFVVEPFTYIDGQQFGGLRIREGKELEVKEYYEGLKENIINGNNLNPNLVGFVEDYEISKELLVKKREKLAEIRESADKLYPEETIVTYQDIYDFYDLVDSGKKAGEFRTHRGWAKYIREELFGDLPDREKEIYTDLLTTWLTASGPGAASRHEMNDIIRNRDNSSGEKVYKSPKNKLKYLDDQTRHFNLLQQDYGYIIPANKIENSSKISTIQGWVNNLDHIKDGKGEYGKWVDLFKKGGAAMGSAKTAQFVIVRKPGGGYFLNASGEGVPNNIKGLELTVGQVQEIAPEMLQKNPYEPVERLLDINRTPAGTSYLKTVQDNLTTKPSGILRAKGTGKQITTIYNISETTSGRGAKQYRPHVYVKPQGYSNWVKLDFGENNTGEPYDNINSAMIYINDITDEAIKEIIEK